ncbi:MAG: hypothetical protein ACKD6N_01655 [Candidatus Bathyarchaeota archaeon]
MTSVKEKKSLKISSILLVVSALIAIIFGLIYCFTQDLMYYHQDYTGLKIADIAKFNPKFAFLTMIFLRVIGVYLIGYGILLTFIAVKSFLRAEKWAWGAVLVGGLATNIPTLVITYTVKGPWIAALITLILLVVALTLPVKEFFRK